MILLLSYIKIIKKYISFIRLFKLYLILLLDQKIKKRKNDKIKNNQAFNSLYFISLSIHIAVSSFLRTSNCLQRFQAYRKIQQLIIILSKQKKRLKLEIFLCQNIKLNLKFQTSKIAILFFSKPILAVLVAKKEFKKFYLIR